ncbi:MAG: hypothetical protein R3F11_04290 [Verrucomicrobiales bacterium]
MAGRSPCGAAAIREARAAEIYTAILGESAVGDYRARRSRSRGMRNGSRSDSVFTTYFPTRTGFLVDLLRQNDLYPPVEAPEFSQHGGNVASGFELGILEPPARFTIQPTAPTRARCGRVLPHAAAPTPHRFRYPRLGGGQSARFRQWRSVRLDREATFRRRSGGGGQSRRFRIDDNLAGPWKT